MARPTKYTPERSKRITDAIALGATKRLACLYGGITDETMTAWVRRYPAFAEAVRDAEGRAVVGWLAKIEKAANDGEWTAAAWKLERRYPDEYGRRLVQHEGKDGGPIQLLWIEDSSGDDAAS